MTAPATEEARVAHIEVALGAEDSNPAAIRHNIPWKSGSERCTVIQVELDAVVLNPRSHRIKAQLDGHESRTVVESDPFGDEAQQVLALLLRSTDGFEDIKASLDEEGQRDPGSSLGRACSSMQIRGWSRCEIWGDPMSM